MLPHAIVTAATAFHYTLAFVLFFLALGLFARWDCRRVCRRTEARRAPVEVDDRSITEILGGDALKRAQDAAYKQLLEAEEMGRKAATGTGDDRDAAACALLDAIAVCEEYGALGAEC